MEEEKKSRTLFYIGVGLTLIGFGTAVASNFVSGTALNVLTLTTTASTLAGAVCCLIDEIKNRK